MSSNTFKVVSVRPFHRKWTHVGLYHFVQEMQLQCLHLVRCVCDALNHKHDKMSVHSLGIDKCTKGRGHDVSLKVLNEISQKDYMLER